MKKLIVLFLLLICSIAYSQSGVGYLNYTVYNIISNGAGQYANSATDFVNMFDVTKGATVYTSGTSTAAKTLFFANGWQPSNLPYSGSYTGIKITGWFVPKETGAYSFGIDGDDGVDFLLDGNVVTSFYGPHGFGGYRYGSVNLAAGKVYTFMARYQNWGGGWGMYLVWKRPSQSTWTTQANEVYSTQPVIVPSLKVQFNFTNLTNPTTFSTNIYTYANNTYTLTPNNTATAISSTDTVDVSNSVDTTKNKAQGLGLTTTTNLTTLYNNIITVSNVYLAFQEYANQGLLGRTMGNYFTSGVQYIAADVNNDSTFDEKDCYLLLQHLTGKKSLVSTLPNLLKLYNTSTYDSINHSNWSSYSGLKSIVPFTLPSGKLNDTFYVSTIWSGDVKLAYSTTQTAGIASFSLMSPNSNQIQSSIITQLIGDSVYATITLDPLQQMVVGTQYHLNYDSSILQYQTTKFTAIGNSTNFSANRGSYINLGSLITDGTTVLNNTTKYVVIFKPTVKLTNVLGLISVTPVDAVNQSGTQLKIMIN
jgi:hypothetical protein